MSWDSEFILPSGAGVRELTRRLRKLTPCRPDGRRSVERTFLDTFDWRLYNRGKVLEERHDGNDDIVLQMRALRSAGPEVVAKPAAAVRFVRDLPAGTMRRRLESVVQMRALLPVVRVHSRISTLRIIDKNQKTVAFLELEKNKIAAGSRSRSAAELTRARIVPLRGYVKAARGLSQLLVEALECTPAENDTFVAAALLACRKPGAYSAKLDIRLDPDTPAHVASKLVFRRLHEIIRCNENGMRQQIDSEFLHDFRVAVRRTRSALAQLKAAFPQTPVDRYLRDFRWLQQTTGSARDLDVYLLKFADFENLVDRSLHADLRLLKEFLGQQREIAYRRLVRSLDSKRYRKLMNDWQAFIGQSSRERSNSNSAVPAIRDLARKRIWRLYRRAMKEGRRIKTNSPAEHLHELRKTCKKLRYLLELFQGIFPKRKLKKLIRSLRQLQDNLGEFNDLQVQSEVLQSFSTKMYQKKDGKAETLMATGVLVQALMKKKSAARVEFQSHFETFAQPAVDALFRELFHTTAADRAP